MFLFIFWSCCEHCHISVKLLSRVLVIVIDYIEYSSEKPICSYVALTSKFLTSKFSISLSSLARKRA